MTLLLRFCASMPPVAPEVSLLGLQLENLTLSHAILSADLSRIDLHQSLDDRACFTLYENWRSKEDLDQHLQMS